MKQTILTAAALTIISASAYAQTGPELLLMPWWEQMRVEVEQDIVLLQDADSDAGIDSHLNIFETRARLRVDHAAEHSLSFGFQQAYLDTSIHGPGIDEDVLIQSVAVGVPVGMWEGWEIGVTAGFGYAGNSPYDDGEAWFGKGSIVGSYDIDAESSLMLMLVYDGNRTIFPDLPLPGIVYNRTVSDVFRFSLGVPYSSIAWKPADKWMVDLTYFIPYNFDVTVRYQLLKDLSLFGSYDRRIFAYHLEPQRDNDRTFLEHDRIEGGVQWTPCENFDVTLAGGYAFNQEIYRGFDVRGERDAVELDEEPYLRINFAIRF